MSLPEVPPEIQLEKSFEQEIEQEIEQKIKEFIERLWCPSFDAELERKFELERKLKEFHDLFDGLMKDGLTKENFKVYKLLLEARAAEINEKFMGFKSSFEDRVAEMNEKLKGMDDLYQKLTLKKFKIKKGSFKVIDIDGENEAIDGNPDITTSKKHEKQDNTHEAIDGNPETTIFKKHEKQDHTHEAIDGNPDINKHKKQDHTVWASFLALKFGIASSFGNPFDKLPKLLESTGKVKQQSVINSGEALRVFAQPITWNAILFGSFIFSTIHAPLGFRVSANSIQMLLLVYCILAEAEAMSDCAVMWGSTQIPALLFVCGLAIVPVLLIASIIAGLKYSRFSPK